MVIGYDVKFLIINFTAPFLTEDIFGTTKPLLFQEHTCMFLSGKKINYSQERNLFPLLTTFETYLMSSVFFFFFLRLF